MSPDLFGDAARERTRQTGRPVGVPEPEPVTEHAQPIETSTEKVKRLLGDQSRAGGVGPQQTPYAPPAKPSGSLRGALS